MTTNGDGREDRGAGSRDEENKVVVILKPLSASDLHPAVKHEAKAVEHLSVHQINMA